MVFGGEQTVSNSQCQTPPQQTRPMNATAHTPPAGGATSGGVNHHARGVNHHAGGVNHHAEASMVLELALQQMDSILADTDLDLAMLDEESLSTNCSESDSLHSAVGKHCLQQHQAPYQHQQESQSLATSASDPVVQAVERLRSAISLSQKLYGSSRATSISDQMRCFLLSWLRGGSSSDSDQSSLGTGAAGNEGYGDNERVQCLEADKSSLQAHIQALTEQVHAQNERIHELQQQMLTRQRLLGKNEDRLQKDLSVQQQLLHRSSFETQKLQLVNQLSGVTLHQRQLQAENQQLRRRLQQLEARLAAGSEGLAVAVTDSPPATDDSSRSRDKPPVAPRPVVTLQNPTISAQSPVLVNGATQQFVSPQHSTPLNECSPNSQRAATMSRNATTTSKYSSTSTGACSSTGVVDTCRRITSLGGTLPRVKHSTSSISPALPPSSTSYRTSDAASTPTNSQHRLPLNGRHSATTAAADGDNPSSPADGHRVSGDLTALSASPCMPAKRKSLKKLFGKMVRGSSGSLENIHSSSGGGGDAGGKSPPMACGGQFRRGGVRATAAARLGWSATNGRATNSASDEIYGGTGAFVTWSTAALIDWLHEMGLSVYTDAVRRHITDGGRQLAALTAGQLEKLLDIKNPLHLKKLALAICDLTSPPVTITSNTTNTVTTVAATNGCDSAGGNSDGSPTDYTQRRQSLPLPSTALPLPVRVSGGRLDHSMVVRWLDDVGLPMYKPAFQSARVDGRQLSHLSGDDLHALRVTTVLHALSLRRGIQVLRSVDFSVGCLRRRSTCDERRPPASVDVALWTNHRVMEWLREIDLAEYAPNMRGSGVHGALMVYETRFTGELLATILAIPANKTLLRRHLYTRFGELVGGEVLKEKRDLADSGRVPPLRLDTKIKRRGALTLRRRRTRAVANSTTNTTHTTTTTPNGDSGGGGVLHMHRWLFEDLLCPLYDPSTTTTSTTARIFTATSSARSDGSSLASLTPGGAAGQYLVLDEDQYDQDQDHGEQDRVDHDLSCCGGDHQQNGCCEDRQELADKEGQS